MSSLSHETVKLGFELPGIRSLERMTTACAASSLRSVSRQTMHMIYCLKIFDYCSDCSIKRRSFPSEVVYFKAFRHFVSGLILPNLAWIAG